MDSVVNMGMKILVSVPYCVVLIARCPHFKQQIAG